MIALLKEPYVFLPLGAILAAALMFELYVVMTFRTRRFLSKLSKLIERGVITEIDFGSPARRSEGITNYDHVILFGISWHVYVDERGARYQGAVPPEVALLVRKLRRTRCRVRVRTLWRFLVDVLRRVPPQPRLRNYRRIVCVAAKHFYGGPDIEHFHHLLEWFIEEAKGVSVKRGQGQIEQLETPLSSAYEYSADKTRQDVRLNILGALHPRLSWWHVLSNVHPGHEWTETSITRA